jgi:hypothetical protein
MMLAVLMAFLSVPALAQDSDSAIGNEIANADQAQDKAETETADEAKEPDEFKVPAGYRVKKRGTKVVYCKKDMESGTRFAQERCFDEEQLKQKELAEAEGNAAFDQARKICSNLEACGGS